jgi:hypothetical protein
MILLRMRFLILLILLCATGCTHFEYELVKPPDLAQHIGTKEDVTFAREPLEYRLRSYEDRLVIRIYNNADDPVQLIGEQSAVVDPQGQSHPLRSATIESHSFIKLIIPPIPPTVEPYGPSIGIGFGMVAQRDEPSSTQTDAPLYLMLDGHHFRRGYYGVSYWDPWPYDYYAPRYYAVYDQTTWWQWKGEGEARVALTFARNDKTFRDEFTFKRVKRK